MRTRARCYLVALAAAVGLAGATVSGCTKRRTRTVTTEVRCVSVVPSLGPTTGGTAVTIGGDGFQPGAIVRFGQGDATGAAVNADGTEITCLTPPGPTGLVDVVVWNPDGVGCRIVDGFAYVGPTIQGAIYLDANANGITDLGDTLTVSFSGEVRVQGTPVADGVFLLDPPGSFGPAAIVVTGSTLTEVVALLDDGANFQPNGLYGSDPGSAGLDLAAGQPGLVDQAGFAVQPIPTPIDVEGELNPRVADVAYTDVNENCIVDFGDTLDVTFTTNVTLTTADPVQAFQLPVSGDSLGTGAVMVGGIPADVKTITVMLGGSPNLRVFGMFDSSLLTPGSPSGLDVAPMTGVIVDALHLTIAAMPRSPPGLEIGGPKPFWTSVGDDQAGAIFGIRVAADGDVNRDGFSDVVVCASSFDTGNADAGKAYLYLGGPSGPSTSPAWAVSGDDQADAYFGGHLCSAGDANGDGYSDVVIGASHYVGTATGVGKAYLYLGGPMGLSPTPSWTSTGDDEPWALFGSSGAFVGDVNDDGFSDVVIGAPTTYQWPAARPGKAFLYQGGAAGFSATPAWTSEGDGQRGAGFSWSVSSAGDVNNDGLSDVIIGSPEYRTSNRGAGRAYVYLGGPTGLSSVAIWVSSGDDRSESLFGQSVASAGDVNGDGFSDVIVGADHFKNKTGKAYLYLGTPSGVSPNPVWTSLGDDREMSMFGVPARSAGDLNGDGFSDIVVSARGFDLATSVGRVFLYLGGPTGPSSTPAWTSSGEDTMRAHFGFGLGAGDVNGDGLPELLVGAYGFSSATSGDGAGKVYLYCVRP